jgi:hypothetical protein
MKESSYEKIRSEDHFDVYGPPEGILKAVVGERPKRTIKPPAIEKGGESN